MVVKTIPAFTENALTVLCKRYLSKAGESVHAECTRCGAYHETPVELLQRTSFGVEEFYELMARKDFFPNSPTLFNAGLNNGGTFSGCFKFDVADNMLEPSGIMDVAVKAAGVMKWGGGVGYSMSGLREKGAIIRSTHGFACGPVSVMQNLYQGVATMITQAGKRDGAQMAILHCDHPDVEEFINAKSENPKVLDTFNISVACTNEFMRKATEEQGRERALLWQMARAAHKTGDPGCYFIDVAEAGNPTPWLGQLTGTNPCGEVPLMDNEPCNLGSINLKNFVIPNHRYDVSAVGDLPESRHVDTGPQFDFTRLREVARVATRFLDRILDENTFPHPDIDTMARRTRKLGLGVMGWADTLALMHIDYDSEEALELGEKIMEAVQTAAHETSEALATEKGIAPAFDLNVLHDLLDEYDPAFPSTAPQRRNATLTCIAPTGTISIIAGCSSSIEPHFALENTRYMGDGTPLAEMVNVESGWIPKVAHQVDWRWHLRHQMAFQKYTDLAVSKTINVPVGISPEEIHKIYIEAWQSGCKGITIYRDHSQSRQVLETNGKGPKDLLKVYPGKATGPCCKEFGETGKHSHSEGPFSVANFDDDPDKIIPMLPSVTSRVGLPDDRQAMIHRFQIGNVDGYLTCGLYPDGSLGEIFVRASRQGSAIDGLLDTIAMLTSHCLQHGVPLEYLIEKMRGRSFEPSGLTGNANVPHASSIVDYIFRWLGEQFLTEDQKGYMSTNGVSHTGQMCPDCGHMTVNQSNCDLCLQCGWERC